MGLSFLKYLAFIIIIMFFLVGNGNVHLFDWDEINFAECAREMIISGNYTYPTIAFQPFYEKPPLFFWMQALSMKICGIGEFSARFPNALAGVLILLVLYYYGKKYFFKQFAYLWPMMYICGILPFLYLKSGIIDPWFNFFMFISIMEYYLYLIHKKYGNFIISSFSLALAVFTKGPVGILIVSFCIIIIDWYYRHNLFFSFVNGIKHMLFVLLTVGGYCWYLIHSGNEQFIYEFIRYQVRLFSTEDSGHGGPFWFHLPVLFFGCFPASFFAILQLYVLRTNENKKFSILMLISLLWVILLFSIVKTKIVHYSSFCYFPISWFAANYFYKRLTSGWFELDFKWVYYIILLIIMLILCLSILLKFFLSAFSNLIHDETFNSNRIFLGSDSAVLFLVGLTLLLSVAVIIVRWKFNFKATILSMMGYSLLFVVALFHLVPRIEILSQRGLIEIFKLVRKYDAYTETVNFKSYAYFFYAERLPIHYQNNEILKEIQNVKGDFVSFNHKYLHVLLNHDFKRPQILVYKGTIPHEMISNFKNYKQIKTSFGYTLLIKPQNADKKSKC